MLVVVLISRWFVVLNFPLTCTWRSESPVSLVLVMVDLKAILLLFKLLKVLSAWHVVTGSVQRIFTKAEMLGYLELTRLNVCRRLVRKLLSQWSSSSFRHFIFQL